MNYLSEWKSLPLLFGFEYQQF